MNKLKFALVGCGRIARKQAEALTSALKEKAQLAAVDVDVVTVLTESGNHARHTIDIVNKYRKHMVVEKLLQFGL